jgi:hypothetical protein
MITINLKQKTKKNGHLVIDVPTTLIDKNVDIVLVIQEKEETPKNSQEKKTKKKYDFSHLYGKLEWKGDALAEQKKIRSEWE